MASDPAVTRERLLALPKAELHVHLDGSLRPATLVELADAEGVSLPTHDPAALANLLHADDARDLEDYLRAFATTLSVMQSAPALERIAYELAEDHASENVRVVEVRFSPVLTTRGGLTLDETLEATLTGLRRAEADFPIRAAVIVCALRHLEPSVSDELAELAVRWKGRGVVAFDLASGEAGNPARDHWTAFRLAAKGNLGRTVHAGEAWGPESILQALVHGRAQRLGHGTRLHENPELETYVRDHRVPLEICLTSNVQTRAAPGYMEHPARRYFDLGIPMTFCTDNRLMSGTTVTDEYLLAAEHLGFTWEELVTVARMGFESAFLPWPEKRALLEDFDRVAAEL
jgi:adenosine deaminase